MAFLSLPNAVHQQPIRSVISQFRNLCLALWLSIGLASACAAQSAPNVELTLDQARDYAIHALRNGDPGLAIQLSRGLLKANPKDPVAHFLIASAHASLNQPHAGRLAAAKAYRFSKPGPDRFRAAQLAAQLSYRENRPTLTQIWLRRTAIHARSDQDLARIGRDYQALRRLNPWSLRIRSDLRPSNNVNNGADTALQIIDGVPVTGTLSGSARALSGLIASLDVATTYRLYVDQNSITTIGGRVYVQRVALSNSAKTQAPQITGSLFGSTFAELSVRHGFAIGPKTKGGSGAVTAAFGESWWGGQRSYRFARLRLDRSWRLNPRTQLSLHGIGERQYKARYVTNDGRILGFGGVLSHGLANGDRVSVSVALRDADAKHANGTFSSASMRTDYTFAKRLGPAQVTAGMIFGYSDYPAYRSGVFWIPGGRQDKSAYADVSLFFDQYDYAGFAPKLRLRAGRKRSNDSRFNTREISISLGVESKF